MAREYVCFVEGRRTFDRDAFDRDWADADPLTLKLNLRRAVEQFRKRPAIPGPLRRAVYERDGHACLHCRATERLSLDHIVPYSRGGQDELGNLQTLCLSCNSRKGDGS